MEFAREGIFREIDVLEEWLGLGRPALRRSRPWLAATLGLGVLFLAGQAMAWKQLTAQGFAFDRFATPASYFFYIITGLHAAHLAVGTHRAFWYMCVGARWAGPQTGRRIPPDRRGRQRLVLAHHGAWPGWFCLPS